MNTIHFIKMHGIGNDYVYVNCFDEANGCIDDPAAIAPKIADRHYGVGGDGLILVMPPEPGVDAHVRMRMFNADGSESEMCGNGIRCVCKLAHDEGISRANPMKIQTGRGVLSLSYTTGSDGKVDQVTVDMGEPIWNADDVPVRVDELNGLFAQLRESCDELLCPESPSASAEGAAGGTQMTATCMSAELACKWLSMGNPHIVFFVPDVQRVPLERIGPLVEFHEAFPRRINVHVAQVHSRGEVTMRTWERGSGMTLACGTGAAAVCAAGAALNLTDREILAHLPGGDLRLRWDKKTNHIFKTGPATEVFRGTWKNA